MVQGKHAHTCAVRGMRRRCGEIEAFRVPEFTHPGVV
jgi:hypothetical protein